jgi:hypothetical protein
MERFSRVFAAKDRAMQIENDFDKEVNNCDIGYFEDVDRLQPSYR